MKPLTLTMSAFGPYEKETSIDFRKFDNSLFLITGRTGSGKTTIFDGIMYSLFGEVSGGERKAVEMRTKFVSPKTVTSLKLDFEHGGDVYTVERSIRSSRNTADATLYCPDGTTVEGLKKVNDFIPELIGITPGQFRGVVMLAQGKFRELLSAKSDDRADILRKIFSTDIYKLFQTRLKEKANEVNSTCRKEVSTIETMIRSLSCPEEMTSLSSFLENPIVGSESMEKLSEAISGVEKEDQNRLSVLTKEIETKESLSREAAGNLAKARDTNLRLENLQKERNDLASLLEKENYYRSLEAETKLTRNAEKVASVENGWKKACDDVKLFEQTIKEKTEFVEKNSPQVAILAKNVEELEKSPDQEKWQKEKGTLERALPQYDELEKTNAELVAEIKRRETQQKKIEEIKKSVKELLDVIRNNEETLKTLDRVEVQRMEKKTLLEGVVKEYDKFTGLEGILGELIKQKETADTAKKESDAARELFTSLEKKAVDLENRLWDGQAGVLAEKLVEGEACPVCGSTVHPHPASCPAAVPTKTEVDAARKKAETARKTVDTAVAKTERAQADYDAKAQLLASSVKEYLENPLDVSGDILAIAPVLARHKNSLEKEKEVLTAAIRDLDAKCTLRNELELKKPELQKSEEQEESRQEEENKSLQKSMEEIKGLTSKKDTLAHGLQYPSKKEAEDKLVVLNKNISGLRENLSKAQKKLNSLRTAVDQADGAMKEAEAKLKTAVSVEKTEHVRFMQALTENGFADEEAYRTALEGLETLEEDEKKVADYRQNLNQKKGSVATMERDTQGLTPIDITQLTETESSLRGALEDLRKKQSDLQHRILDNAKYMKRIRDAWSSSEKLMEEYAALSELSAIANGEVSGNKLDLERYIMAAFFDDVLENANRKLSGMTDGRYQLIRSADSTDKRKTIGLDLAVIDRYSMGISRGTHTLSGGESFMAALSLALGLSDAIQQSAGGISINALFVDEGFDSLDTDTLQEVLKVLQGLTTGTRLVGIISHVESLKEQIEKKIVVTKLGDGKSVVRIEG